MKTVALLLLLAVGQAKEKTPYLDQTRSLLPEQDWNREIVNPQFPGGNIYYKIQSSGGISLTILSDRGYKKLQRVMKGEDVKIERGDVLMSKDFDGPITEGWTPVMQKGSNWFLITNNLGKSASIRLQCWREKK